MIAKAENTKMTDINLNSKNQSKKKITESKNQRKNELKQSKKFFQKKE